MEHLFFWALIFTFAVGLVSLTAAIVVYGKTRGALLRCYIGYHASLTLLVLLGSLLAYVGANMPNRNPALFEILDYFESPLATYCVMFMTPVFIHELFAVPAARARNVFFAIFIGVAYVFYSLFAFVVPLGDAAASVMEYVEDHPIFIAVMLYGFVTGVANYRRLEEGDTKRTAKRFLVLFGVFLPGIIQDKIGLTPFRFFPVFYCCFSALFTYTFIRRDFTRALSASNGAPDAPIDFAAQEELFQKYEISNREKEIVAYTLRGCSYKEIADKLFISENTVKTHIRNIYPKFGVNSRFELMALFQNRGKPEKSER